MTGCSLFISADLAFAFTSQVGRVDLPLPIPDEPILVGVRFYNQALVVDGPANSFGATLSNASEALIGAK